MADELSWSEVEPHVRGVASLATVTPDGSAHVAIVSSAYVEATIWIAATRSSRKALNIAANPSVALVWSGDAEVYVWGSAELVDDLDVKRSLWADAWPYDPAMFFGSPENPDYTLVRVTPARAMTLTFGPSGPVQARWQA